MAIALQLPGPDADTSSMRICPACGTELPSNSRSKTGACSPGCASIVKGREFQAQLQPIDCGACGDPFIPSDHQRWRQTAEGTRPTCSEGCRIALTSERPKMIGPKVKEWVKANRCPMHPHHGQWSPETIVYPSRCIDCGLLEFRRGPSKRCKPCVSRFADSNKTKRHRARYVEIHQRDRWICQLCDEPINRDAHYLDPDAATIDHIIPRSKGGSDEIGNLWTAHRRCNTERGNRPLPGRLY